LKIPKILTKENKKYYFIKLFKNYAMYKTEKGIVECFNFHDLGLIKEVKRDREAKNGGWIKA